MNYILNRSGGKTFSYFIQFKVFDLVPVIIKNDLSRVAYNPLPLIVLKIKLW